MTINTLQELFLSQLRDIYSAEEQITSVGPKAADAATNESLTKAIRDHLEQSKEQMDRLDRCFTLLGEKSDGEKCAGMEGLLKELNQSIRHITEPAVLDAALIADLRRVEHYEISAYGTAATIAKMLGQNEIAQVLERSMEEERSTDIALSGIAETVVNPHALAARGMAHVED